MSTRARTQPKPAPPSPMPLAPPPNVIAVEIRSPKPGMIDTHTHRAKIETYDGWWFRYAVHRTVGIGIPENSCSLHRTLKGARRAAARWKTREYRPVTVSQ